MTAFRLFLFNKQKDFKIMLLEAFRNHKRWLMFIAMVLVIPSFVVTGIYSYNRMMSDDGAIAKVDDASITPQDFDEAKRKQLDNLRAQLGDQFRANMLDNPEARVALLQNIMNNRSLASEAIREHVEISEGMAIEIIKTFPAFQTNGKFDPKRYQNYLASAGYSDEYFVHMMRADIARNLLTGGITRTLSIPDVVSGRVFDLLTERRNVALHRVSAEDYIKGIDVSEQEARKYWQDHQKAFELPDEIDVQFVTLSPALFTNVKPSEEDVRTFYEQNQNRFKHPEERRASHILIDFSKGKEAAKKLAEEVLAKAKGDPKSFGKLAKEYSADPGSAQAGGDLDYFGKGMMVAPFEQAVFAAKKGDIVGPVESDFGYHIIHVTDIKPAAVRPLKEVRNEIEALYKEQESQKQFATEAENFTNMVYEQSDSLQSVIEKYNLKPVTVKNVTVDGPTDPTLKRIINANVLESLFGDECLREKRNTQAIEVAPNVLVAARVLAYRPAHIEQFDKVKQELIAELKHNKAVEKAAQVGEKILAEFKAGKGKAVEFGKVETMSRVAANSQNFELVSAVMREPAEKLPAYAGVKTDQGYVIAKIEKSEHQKIEPTQLQGVRNELEGMFAPAEQAAYFASLRKKHDAKILNKDYMPGEADADAVQK